LSRQVDFSRPDADEIKLVEAIMKSGTAAPRNASNK
jgi:hypothetical protein